MAYLHPNGKVVAQHIERGAVHTQPQFYASVFEPSQAEIGFGQKVAAAARWVEKTQTPQFFLKIEQGSVAFFCTFAGTDVVEFGLQLVEKQRVYHLVNVFDAGVVHAAASACFGVERAFEHGTEDGWRNFAPVEIGTGALHQQLFDLLAKLRNRQVFFGKKSAIDIGKIQQFLRHFGVAVGLFGVECFE